MRRARSSTSTTRPRRWSSSARATRRGWPTSAPPAPTTSCAPRSSRCCSIPAGWSARARRTWTRRSRPTAPTTPATTSAARKPGSPPMRDANPVVVLHPRVGMFTLAKDKATARIASEFYRNAINVMRGAEAVGGYLGLPEQEAFDIEYWALEEAKLRRMPPPAPLEGRIALITGGAGGIGRATAERLLADGACVVLADIDRRRARQRRSRAARRNSARDRVRRAEMDVTDEAAVDRRRGVRGARVRRARHPGRQRRHRLGRADRGDHAGDLAAQPRHPRRGLLPGQPRGVPADEGAWAARSSSSAPRTRWRRASTPPPTPRPRPRPCTWRGAWRWKARRTASGSTWSIPTR